jgi:hypothetical protein
LTELVKISQVTENPLISANQSYSVRSLSSLPLASSYSRSNKVQADRKDTVSTFNQPFPPRATLFIDRRDFQTVSVFIPNRGNGPPEPPSAWAVGRQHVTSRHGGRDKDNPSPDGEGPVKIICQVDDDAHKVTNAILCAIGISRYASAVFKLSGGESLLDH